MANAYLTRRAERDLAVQEASRQTYLQYFVDLLSMVLNDPDVMGGDTFGSERIKKVVFGIEKYYDVFLDALDNNREESDYYREKMDERLRQIFPDKDFVPFDKRYDYCEKLVPLGKEKK